MVADISVTDRTGNPIIGLRAENFRLSESGRPVGKTELVWQGSERSPTSVVIVVERSPAMNEESLTDALDQIYRALAGRVKMSLITAGDEASLQAQPGASRLTFLQRARYIRPATAWKLDDAVRMAGAQLVPTRGRRVIVFVGTGLVSLEAYASHSVSELSQYLINNAIPFYAVITSLTGISCSFDKTFHQIVRLLCGQLFRLYRIGRIINCRWSFFADLAAVYG